MRNTNPRSKGRCWYKFIRYCQTVFKMDDKFIHPLKIYEKSMYSTSLLKLDIAILKILDFLVSL